jgi:hypothetical protein
MFLDKKLEIKARGEVKSRQVWQVGTRKFPKRSVE